MPAIRIFFLVVLSFSFLEAETMMTAKTGYTETSEVSFLENLKNKVKKHTLPNGLRVLLMENGITPTVALYWKILAGASDEDRNNTGIAHMLEHMLFKGTKVVGTLDFSREEKYLDVLNRWYERRDALKKQLRDAGEEQKKEIEDKLTRLEKRIAILEQEVKKFQISEEDSIIYSLHGQKGYNAYTSKDVTNYQIELPGNKIELWARLESDRVRNSVFREFYTERNVIAEERMMRVENNPVSYLMEAFLSAIYKDHPYGYPTIGWMENIQSFRLQQAKEFYENFYRPENTVIGIVGRFDPESTLSILEKYFGDWENPPEPVKRRKPPEWKYESVEVSVNKEGSPVLMLAWRKPNFPEKDDLVLGLLSDVLAGRTDTRLEQRLVHKEKLATNISIYTTFPGERYENLFFVFITPNPKLISDKKNHNELKNLYDKITEIVMEEVEKISKEGIEESELRRVKQIYLTDFIRRMRSNAYLADILTYAEAVYGDYRIVFDYYKQIENITGEDVRNATREYLTKEKMSRAYLLP